MAHKMLLINQQIFSNQSYNDTMSDEVLAWLSVWRDLQMIYIWSSRCHCPPSSLASLKSRLV